MTLPESPEQQPDGSVLLQGSRIIAAGLLASIFLSLSLWNLQTRYFPQVSIFPISHHLDGLASVILILSLITVCIWGLRRSIAPVLLYAFTYLILTDISRLRSFTFLYFCLFFTHTVALLRNKETCYIETVTYWKWILALLYFWSGFHKLNAVFLVRVGPFLLKTLQQTFAISNELVALCSAVIPLTELGLGILLCFARTQRIAVLGLLGTHLFILYTLGPFDKNISHIVWPWNLTMCGLLYVLFWKSPKTLTLKRSTGDLVLVLVFFLMPALHVVDRWNGELSFNMFSGRVPEAYLYPSEKDREQAPGHIKEAIDYENGVHFIDINDYALKDIQVLAFPEHFAVEQTVRELCKEIPGSKVIFKKSPPVLSIEAETRSTTCQTLLGTAGIISPSDIR